MTIGRNQHNRDKMPPSLKSLACHRRARLIMEKELGRKLNTFEYVHHIDGDFTNNTVSNLKIVPAGEHTKLHCRGQFWDIKPWMRPGTRERNIVRAKAWDDKNRVKWQPCHDPPDTKNCKRCYHREWRRRNRASQA